MQKLEKIRSESKFCIKVLNMDSNIRFVGILCKCGRLKAYYRKKEMIPRLGLQETKLVQRQALLKAKMNRVFDKKLGKTTWSIELREDVKWITVYFNKDLVLLSTEIFSDHNKIVEEILSALQASPVPY